MLDSFQSDLLKIERTKKPIRGSLAVAGSSNQVTKAIMASLLTDDDVHLHQTPRVEERQSVLKLLQSLGGKVDELDSHSLKLNANELNQFEVPKDLSKRNRISVLSLPGLLHRFGQASLPKELGGDQIGSRPVNFHLDALQKMGAICEEEADVYNLSIPNGLKGVCLNLPFPSVMTTENVLLAASVAKGRSVIQNAAIEPEVLALVRMLQTMGADISYTSNRTFVIEGQKSLRGTTCYLMPDRNEAVSYACLALATGGEILLENVKHEDIFSFLNLIQRMGGCFESRPEGMLVKSPGVEKLQGVFVEVEVPPGFMTDWQQPLMVLLTQAQGVSLVHETIFESRLNFTEDLVKMGAQITLYAKCLGEAPCRFKNQNHLHSAVVLGRTPLTGHSFHLRTDIRSGMALVIAGCIAQGQTFLSNAKELQRKYEDLVKKLNQLGVDAAWVKPSLSRRSSHS
jgi:UDP-N-acetylglucosamine 1-carboxyvinyltransferase